MIKHGLLLCSFKVKRRFSSDNDENYICLNSINTHGYETEDFFDIFKRFVDSYSEFHDSENNMKMFAIDEATFEIVDKETYKYATCEILCGSYGIESQITNRETKEVVYDRKKEDADVKRFQMFVYIPQNIRNAKITKGVFVFETIGNYGIKSITVDNIRRYLSDRYEMTLITRSISVQAFIEKLFNEEKISKITMIRNNISPDLADNMIYNAGREERSFIKPKFKENWLKTLAAAVCGKPADNQILEINDVLYEDIKITFNHFGRSKTISLIDIDKFSLVEDVPANYYPNGDVDRAKMVSHIESVVNQYAEQMIFTN